MQQNTAGERNRGQRFRDSQQAQAKVQQRHFNCVYFVIFFLVHMHPYSKSTSYKLKMSAGSAPTQTFLDATGNIFVYVTYNSKI